MSRIVFSRDDEGRLLSERMELAGLEALLGAHGNWTERIVYQRLDPNADERRRNIDFPDIPDSSAAQLKAMRRVGYQTLINEVLARHARKDVA